MADIAAAIQQAPDAFIGERARRRLLWFTDRMVAGYDAAPHIAEKLVPALERVVSNPNGRLIVTMPPRHSKSLHVSENLPAWYLGRNPQHRIIAASHTAQLAYTFSRRVRNKIQDPKYPFGVSVADDKGAVQAWDTSEGGGYLSVGAGGSPTGSGGNGIIIDDPIRSAADADSQTVRDSLWEWYQGTMRTRLEPNGWIIVTATRWHEDDLTGRLLQEAEKGGEKWEHLYLPALDDAGNALWPDRWGVGALDAIRRSVGSRAWTAQYQGNPQPAEGGMFKRHWWRYWQPQGANLPPVSVKMPDGSSRHAYAQEIPTFWDASAQSWDMTFKQTKSGSYVVGLAAIMNGANSYILDRYRDRVEFTGALQAVRRFTDKHPHIDAKLIEDKANGPAVIDTLRNEIHGIIAVGVDGSKEARAASSTARVEAGNWFLPHPDIAPWVTEFVDELASFPLAPHDDQADAFSQLDRYLYNLGGDYSDLDDYYAHQFGGR